MDAELCSVLRDVDVQPVLVDVGSSGGMPPIWRGIARESIYVGFDPDLREGQVVDGRDFRRAFTVNRAVVASDAIGEARFYLTRSPHCSSTLRPDAAALQDYLFAGLFDVERETSVPATTLTAVLRDLSLDRIDWLKTDSQGTDLRLFLSVPEDQRKKMLAIDLEPGLIDAYEGEDLFPQVHDEMRRCGFWLSNMDVRGSVRLRPDGASALGTHVTARALKTALRTAPGWVQARYLRAPEWVRDTGGGPREFVLLWAFALADRHIGFALDVVNEFRRLFPHHVLVGRLQMETHRRLRRALRWRRLRQTAGLAGRMSARVHNLIGR